MNLKSNWKTIAWSILLLVAIFAIIQNSAMEHIEFWNGIMFIWAGDNLAKSLERKLS